MSRVIYYAFIFLFIVISFGCGKKATCSSEDVNLLVDSIIKNSSEGQMLELKNNSEKLFDISSIKSAQNQLKITIENIRTEKKEQESTKSFCVADINISIPSQMVKDAEFTLKEINSGLDNIEDLVKKNNFKNKGQNNFTKEIHYNVQLTDDKKKFYCEVENTEPIVNFVLQVVGTSLLKTNIELTKKEENAREEKRKAEMAQLEKDMKDVELLNAKNEFEGSNRIINELWNNLSSEIKTSLISEQRLWIKKKEVDCKIESTRFSDPNEKEILRLNCETSYTNQRISELRQKL